MTHRLGLATSQSHTDLSASSASGQLKTPLPYTLRSSCSPPCVGSDPACAVSFCCQAHGFPPITAHGSAMRTGWDAGKGHQTSKAAASYAGKTVDHGSAVSHTCRTNTACTKRHSEGWACQGEQASLEGCCVGVPICQPAASTPNGQFCSVGLTAAEFRGKCRT